MSLRSALEEQLVAALARSAPAVLALAHGQDTRTLERLARALDCAAESMAGPRRQHTALDTVRANLFEGCGNAEAGRFQRAGLLGCVRRARMCGDRAPPARRSLSRPAIRPDGGVLLRDPARYQAPLEEALRRARIEGWFSQGSVRPDPSGRAFLALLDCAADGYSASGFAEYVSFGQVPSPDGENWTPAGWERRVVDAAVIGGADRWERRLDGLAVEYTEGRVNLPPATRERRLLQLQRLRNFAVPLIELLDAPASRWTLGRVARIPGCACRACLAASTAGPGGARRTAADGGGRAGVAG